MVSPIANSSCAILALLLSFNFFTQSFAITETDVTAVCSATVNPDFCSTFLNSIPGLPTATFRDLSQETVSTIVSKARIIIQLINNLRRGRVDPRGKKSLALCSQSYRQVLEEMRTSLRSLVLGDRPQLLASASASINLAANCHRELHGSFIVLGVDNQDVEDYSSILLELSKRL